MQSVGKLNAGKASGDDMILKEYLETLVDILLPVCVNLCKLM